MVLFRDQPLVFITHKLTSRLIDDDQILEPIPCPRRLYQYLNWTIKINKMAGTDLVLESGKGRRVMVIDVELHNPRRQRLYALSVANNNFVRRTKVLSFRSEPWNLLSLLTASELTHLLDINAQCLPRGVRAGSVQFQQYRSIWSTEGDLKGVKAQILRMDEGGNMVPYSRLKCIRAGNGKMSRKQSEERVLELELTPFYDAVQSALKNKNVDLVPIVSRTSKRAAGHDHSHQYDKEEDFSVDYLLPVRVGADWIGVVYRNGHCLMALMDRYDITNKAILCDPSFDVDQLKWFKNRCNKLRVIREHRTRSNGSPTGCSVPSMSSQATVGSTLCLEPRHSVSRSVDVGWDLTPSATPTMTTMTMATGDSTECLTPAPSITPLMSSVAVDSVPSLNIPPSQPTSQRLPLSINSMTSNEMRSMNNQQMRPFVGSPAKMLCVATYPILGVIQDQTPTPPQPSYPRMHYATIRSVFVSNRDLLEFMDRLIEDMVHNEAYYRQFLA